MNTAFVENFLSFSWAVMCNGPPWRSLLKIPHVFHFEGWHKGIVNGRLRLAPLYGKNLPSHPGKLGTLFADIGLF